MTGILLFIAGYLTGRLIVAIKNGMNDETREMD